MSNWQNEKCLGCGEGFNEAEWIDAHTAHDSDCGVWNDRIDECRCTRQYHARCCPDCSGKKLREANEKFAHVPTEELIQNFIETLKYASICDTAVSMRAQLPPDCPGIPTLAEEEKGFAQVKAVLNVIGELLEARGIDPTRFLGGE